MGKIQRRKSLQDPPLVPPEIKRPHVKVVYERRSLALTPEQWEAWDWMAEQMAALARGGPRRGKPSWRTLAADIADEAIKERKKIKQEIKETIDSHTTIISRAEDIKA